MVLTVETKEINNIDLKVETIDVFTKLKNPRYPLI